MNDMEKIKAIVGQELKYSELCKALEVQPKYGNSKSHQLKDLSLYCDIQWLDDKKRYIITEAYEQALPIIDYLNSNNKFQLAFDAGLYQLFIMNNSNALYVSNMDLLKLFQEVNDNFQVVCWGKIDEDEYYYMAEMGQIVYKILTQWTTRRIQQMAERKIVTVADGFRLYRPYEIEGKEYHSIQNVTYGTALHQECQKIYSEALEKLGLKESRVWLDYKVWNSLKKELKKKTMEWSHGLFDNIKSIKILTPPPEEWIRNKLIKTYQELNIPAFEQINQEAMRKIMNTTQLSRFSEAQKMLFIDVNIRPEPEIKLFPHT